jgi:hypothetical protein
MGTIKLFFCYFRFGTVNDLSWQTINTIFQDQGVDAALTLIDLIRSLPATSVCNERSFSHMKIVKTGM